MFFTKHMLIWSCIKRCRKKKTFHIFLYIGWDNSEIELSSYFGDIKIKQVYGTPFYRNHPCMQIWIEEILFLVKKKKDTMAIKSNNRFYVLFNFRYQILFLLHEILSFAFNVVADYLWWRLTGICKKGSLNGIPNIIR